MRQLLPVFFLLSIAISIFNCQYFSAKNNIKKFYFPTENLREGKIYEYQSLNGDTAEREYWHLKSMKTDTGEYLVTTFYDRYFKINQILKEKIVDNGSVAKSLKLYEVDYKEGVQFIIEPTLEAGNLFPFEVTDSTGVFLYKLHYSMPNDPESKIYLIRNRRFGGAAPDFSFKNQKLKTISFKLVEILGHEKEGSAEGQAVGEEWYAEGIGLVQFIKSLGRGNHNFTREFRLVDIYPMSELEKKARVNLMPKEK